MREIIVNKCNSTIDRIKDCFLYFEIKFRFHDVRSEENLSSAKKNWSRFYEMARCYMAPIELVDDEVNRDASTDFLRIDSPIDDEQCYSALQGALIACLKVEIVNDPNAFYGILDGVDKLNIAWYNLGRAELYAEIQVEGFNNYIRAAKGGAVKNAGGNEKKMLLAEELKRIILDVKDSKGRMSRNVFVDFVTPRIIAYTDECGISYTEDQIDWQLFDIIRNNKEVSDLFKTFIAKK